MSIQEVRNMSFELEEQDNLNFIELAYKISLVDGTCSREEYNLLVKYQQELGIDYFPDTHSIDELIEYFSKRDKKAQKTIWLQLYSLIKADQHLEDQEHSIISKIKSSFTLSSEEFNKITQAVDNLNEAYLKLYEAIE